MTMARDKAARELLAFYREAGVDALLDEVPIDRFAADGSNRRPRIRHGLRRSRPPEARAERDRPSPLPAREREVVSRPGACASLPKPP